MMEFPLQDRYHYRPLRLIAPMMFGWDAFAVQTGLTALGSDLNEDGWYGRKTIDAVAAFQTERGLEADGICGVQTQAKLSQVLGRKFRKGWDLPNGIPYGHIEAESSGLLGNYTATYPNGSRDVGIVQRNTQWTPIAEGFHAAESLQALCERIVTYREKYEGWGVESDRALRLACGSWNAPSWTDTLARGETLSTGAYAHIAGYIARVTAYL